MCSLHDEQTIIKLSKIGVGISGIASFTGISKTNVINKIKSIAEKTEKPYINEEQQEYEVDEMHTYIKNKRNSFTLYTP